MRGLIHSSLCIVLGVLSASCWISSQKGSNYSDESYVKVLYSRPQSLDPSQINDTAGLVVSNLLYDGLFTFTDNLEVKGVLALDWKTSPDGKTLWFKLKPNVRFHDGTLVTAQAVENSFKRLVAPGSQVFSYYDCIEGARAYHQKKSLNVEGIRVLKDDEIEFKLVAPFPPFLSILAGGTAKVLPMAANSSKFFDHPIGSGPFKWGGLQGKTDFVLNRNDEYHSAKALLKRVIFRALDEKDAFVLAKEGKVHDIATYSLSGLEDIFSFGQDIESPIAMTWIIGLNTRLAPFNNLGLRKAFVDSVDTEKFRKTFNSNATFAVGYVPPGFPGYIVPQASDKKNRIVSTPVDGLSIEIAIPKELHQSHKMKTFIESELRGKGWNVTCNLIPWSQLMAGYTGKTLQGFLIAMNMDYPDTEFLVRNFESTNPDNFSGLDNPEIDQLIRLARTTQDRIVRQKIYTDLANKLKELAVTVNLFHPRSHAWIHNCVGGFKANILSDVYVDYTKVYLKKDCLERRG